ncbi:UvrD-helicase domain-containing protein [Sedimentibacter hydroxybenzoicus DSM 7310]|uniref:UvrD-helicase domain-containing protein n=1 Tax=Sedimentibacter hydroxybenzoicus DSM 7310 TaxID=1123245 RepID=A0A974BHP7_SEDHY|nr:UvrD-helicase domain-containing protein [Sedimentibacter hydroxybenzoicus DSM 7310]
MNNKLLIASAGAGKTTLLVKKALTCSNSVLITTFTEENEREIRKKFAKLNNGVIPHNVTIPILKTNPLQLLCYKGYCCFKTTF